VGNTQWFPVFSLQVTLFQKQGYHYDNSGLTKIIYSKIKYIGMAFETLRSEDAFLRNAPKKQGPLRITKQTIPTSLGMTHKYIIAIQKANQ
jgi:hypothetical protein